MEKWWPGRDLNTVLTRSQFIGNFDSMARIVLAVLLFAAASASAGTIMKSSAPLTSSDDMLATCPGYKASNIKVNSQTLTANLKLAGKACNVYGTDLTDLTLEVEYETGK